MKRLPTLTKREFTAFFYSPVAYIVMALFLLLNGYIFSWALSVTKEASMRYSLGFINFFLLFLAPLLTMRLISEEKRAGTIEVLRTAPITDSEIVFSKFLGAMGFYLVLLIPTLAYAGVFVLYQGNPDFGSVKASYLGLVLMGTAFISIGLWASSLTKNQIVAALIAFVILLLFTIGSSDVMDAIIDKVFDSFGSSSAFAKFLEQSREGCKAALKYSSFQEHFETFRKGLIDTKDVVFYLSVTIFFLFLTVKSVEKEKWS